ncbi:MAG: hypothetical protein HDR05_04310 [Lachnospiraceae bacterium]|nr:hypothetical protein [Lachnospiraceae bacterium]
MDKRLDLLNREEFEGNVIKIVNQLSDIKRGCCFAIEGSWGVGKTFVIEEIEERLKLIQSEETNSDRYFVFHYNCWQHDYYEEPAVAIISAMLASIREDAVFFSKDIDNTIKAGYEFAKEKFKEIAGLYIKNKIGINLISLADKIKDNKDKIEDAENEFDEMFSFSQTIEKVRKKMQEIAEKRTIVLFVDELDRCIPQYAIKVLERLHHIFCGLENVVVIMAIDRKQLEHSVEEMFGARKDESSIDIEKYLKKFIDFSMVLDNGIINESYWEKYKSYFDKFVIEQKDDKEEITNVLSKLFATIDIRTQEKIIEKANMVHSLVCNEKRDISLLVFEVMYEVLMMWGLDGLPNIELIDDGRYEFGKKQIEKCKKDILKSLEAEAYERGEESRNRSPHHKYIQKNLYGKIFWYFDNFYYNEGTTYIDVDGYMVNKRRELVVATKFCELCEMIK